MTVPSDRNKCSFTGNGITRVWPYTFLLYDASHLEVWVKRGEAESMRLERGFVLNESARTVTYPQEGAGEPPLSEKDKIILMRVVPVLQLLDLVNQGNFFAEDIERNFDLLVMMIQQLCETLRRAVVGPVDQDDAGVAYQALLEAVEEAKRIRDETAALVVGLSGRNAAELAAAMAELDAELAAGMAAITAATAADVEAAQAAAEEARRHAQDYIPYSFGRFKIDKNANLIVEYFGDAGDDGITINDDGEVIITTGQNSINIEGE